MGPEGAVNILYRRELAAAADPAALRAKLVGGVPRRSSPIRSSPPRAGSSTRSSSRGRRAPSSSPRWPAATTSATRTRRRSTATFRCDDRPVKVLIANRGEIAVRVIRACRELGLGTVAVYSECDRTALHVRLGRRGASPSAPSPAAESYLRIDRIVDVAKRSGASLVHPGYGFLAENEDFAQACVDAGLTFVGPSPRRDRAHGQQDGRARRRPIARRRAGGAGHRGAVRRRRARRGDRGRGRRASAIRSSSRPWPAAAARACARSRRRRSAGRRPHRRDRRPKSAFGDAARLPRAPADRPAPHRDPVARRRARHRRCRSSSASARSSGGIRRSSRSRRRWRSTAATRRAMAECAARVARTVGYTNAGTIEFLLDEDGQFYFLEMNTRLQVEHPVTEMVTGIDLVQWQLRIAHGRAAHRRRRSSALTPRAHAIECRIYAEDPDRGLHARRPGSCARSRCPAGPASATTAASRRASRSRSSTTR